MGWSIRNKILAAILAVTLFTTLVITLALYLRSAGMMEDHYSKDLFRRVQQSINEMEQDMKNIYQMTVKAACDDQLKEELGSYLSSQDETHLEKLAGILKEYGDQNINVTSLYLCIPQKGITVTSEEYPMYQKGDFTEAGELLLEQAGIAPVVMEDFIHYGSRLFSFVETVEGKEGKTPVYLTANLEERTLYYNYIDQFAEKEVKEICLVSQKGEIMASNDSGRIGKVLNLEGIGLPKESQIFAADRKGSIGIFVSGNFTGCGIYMGVQRKEILKDLENLRFSVVALCGGCLLAAAAVAICISQAMYKPLKELTQAMKVVEEGNLEQRVQVRTGDEIGTLSKEFNYMLEHIKELIARLVEEERLKKDAELEALQYQITPHFMYNTLNSIKFAALLRGERELGGLIGDFVELLQASINKKGAFLTVSDELHILENYLNLQRFRYEGKFQVDYRIDSESRSCYIPRLLLQPLAENALLHGLDRKNERGLLQIGAKVEQETLFLWVSDNGRGMTEDQIRQLLGSTEKKTKGLSAVGIPNIRERLKLYYGSRADIQFQSSQEGTTATISLPVKKEQEEETCIRC